MLRVPDPAASAERFAALGFAPDGSRLQVGDKWMVLERGRRADSRAAAAEPHRAARRLRAGAARGGASGAGLDVAEVRDAANTYAVFVWGPDRIKLEYVEHKPGFALV